MRKVLIPIICAAIIFSPSKARGEEPSFFKDLHWGDNSPKVGFVDGSREKMVNLGSSFLLAGPAEPDPLDEGYVITRVGDWIAGKPSQSARFSTHHDGVGCAQGIDAPSDLGDAEAVLTVHWFEDAVADRLWFDGLSKFKKLILSHTWDPRKAELPWGFTAEDFEGSDAPIFPYRLGHIAKEEILEKRLGEALKQLGSKQLHKIDNANLVDGVKDCIEDDDRQMALIGLSSVSQQVDETHIVVAHAMARCEIEPYEASHRKDDATLKGTSTFKGTAIFCLDLTPGIDSTSVKEGPCILVLDCGLVCIEQNWRSDLESRRGRNLQAGHHIPNDSIYFY